MLFCFFGVSSSFILFTEHEEAEGGRGCSGQHEAADVGALSLWHPVKSTRAARQRPRCHERETWCCPSHTTAEVRHYVSGSEWTGLYYNCHRMQQGKFNLSVNKLATRCTWIESVVQLDSKNVFKPVVCLLRSVSVDELADLVRFPLAWFDFTIVKQTKTYQQKAIWELLPVYWSKITWILQMDKRELVSW